MQSYLIYSRSYPHEPREVPEAQLAGYLNQGYHLSKPQAKIKDTLPVAVKTINIISASHEELITSLLQLGVAAEYALQIEKRRPKNMEELLTIPVNTHTWLKIADKVSFN